MFDPNANPEDVAARAAELSLEQLARLRQHIAATGETSGKQFYANGFEIQIANQIAQLMGGYAVLKGYVTLERARGLE